MAEEDDVQQFPDVKDKLAAPKKLSQFEKDRQVAEAKRRKEEEENAAALREFEEVMAGDNDEDDMISRTMGGRGGRAPPSGPRGGPGGYNGGGGRFGAPRSGPGSLPGPGMPPSLKRKREMEEAREAAEAMRAELGYDHADNYHEGMSPAAVQEDPREDNTPKPTVQLSSIPPGTSEQEIKTLLAGTVKVHHVRLSPSTGQGKKSLTAIATLDSGTSAAQIDKTVSALRDRYMGCGFYLSISRHLSSAAQFQGVGATGGSASSEPFGAQKSRSSNPKHSLRNAPPPQDHRGFAPPEYYDQRGPPTRSAAAQVEVHPPLDIATVRAIHTISGKILAQKDANRALEMEALLMTLPEVQKDERFAFLYDSKSPAGVYYRFCLWAPESTDEQKRNAKGPERIFKDLDMDWLPPQKETPFLDLTSLAQAADHVDYDTSDDEADDDGDERKLNKGPGGEPDARMAEKSRLSPLQRARFTRLLSRLPTSIARLRQGDISRISNYVVNHAGGGAEEFVDLLLLNVEKPFSSTLAAKYDTDSGSDSDEDTSSGKADEDEEDDYEPGDALATIPSDSSNAPNPVEDPSNPKLIALYTISDILSASSTAGARNAWKYRTLFEAGLSHQKTFQNLGRLDKELGWGRLKAEQWKRKVGVVLSVWESWSVFTGGVLEGLKKDFYEPPLTEAEVAAAAAEAKQEEAKKAEEEEAGWKSRFKKVESASASPAPTPAPQALHGETMETAAGPIKAPAKASHTRFKPVGGLDGASDSPRQNAPPVNTAPASGGGISLKGGLKGAAVPKRRMRAEDMFGDSDEE
ncbi:hypothetical protein Q7P35_009517 [Cladosporium inversicolor]